MRNHDKRAVLFLSGCDAPVLLHLLTEAEARHRNDPFSLAEIKALRADLDRQIYHQHPEKGWLFAHD